MSDVDLLRRHRGSWLRPVAVVAAHSNPCIACFVYSESDESITMTGARWLDVAPRTDFGDVAAKTRGAADGWRSGSCVCSRASEAAPPLGPAQSLVTATDDDSSADSPLLGESDSVATRRASRPRRR